MIVVLDASAAGEIVSKKQAGVDFINVLMRSEQTLAPELYITEICNIMWKLGRKDKGREDTYIEMADECIHYVDKYVCIDELWKEALRLSQEHDHPIYGMLYAVLARRHDAILLTMDLKLREICEKISVRCKTLI